MPISRCRNEVLLYVRRCWNIKHVENTHYKRRLQQAVTKIVLKSSLYPCQFTRSNPIKLSMHSPPPPSDTYLSIKSVSFCLIDGCDFIGIFLSWFSNKNTDSYNGVIVFDDIHCESLYVPLMWHWVSMRCTTLNLLQREHCWTHNWYKIRVS